MVHRTLDGGAGLEGARGHGVRVGLGCGGAGRAACGGGRGGRRGTAAALRKQRMVSTSSCAAHGVYPERARMRRAAATPMRDLAGPSPALERNLRRIAETVSAGLRAPRLGAPRSPAD